MGQQVQEVAAALSAVKNELWRRCITSEREAVLYRARGELEKQLKSLREQQQLHKAVGRG